MGSVSNRAGRRIGGLLIAVGTVVCLACGSSGGSSGSTPQPAPAPTPAPTPGTGTTADVAGSWSGPAIDSTGGGAMVWQLTQNGASFSGTITITDTSTGLTARGSVSGTISGSSIQFSISIPAGGIETQPSCTASGSGSGSVAGSTITGVYSGSNSCTGSIGSGQITLNKQ